MADNSKFACAAKALTFVERGMSVGLGTGSTAAVFIDLLGKRNREDGLDLTCVATSRASEEQARKLGLPVAEFQEIDSLDAAFDGADQVDPKFNLIKGLGGALVREKIVDYRARRFYVMVGEDKLVKALSGIVPVEVIPMAEEHVRRELVGMGASSAPTRMDGGKKFLSDNGNFILHASFPKIADPPALEREVMLLPGVVDNGIFTSRNVAVVVGKKDGTSRLLE
ncbi:MAG: ribose-5-phosphate isomerase RpiA [Candidatus Micrarchaeota archaeon]|nr:ribose-5-phosphate isomerase RpiA [Candidatus Micrarchaeota archaeon]